MSLQPFGRLFFLIVISALLTLPSFADEGMWTLDNPPRKQLKEKYGFEPTQEWLDHVRLSSVRIGDGGSGSFVSPNGLIITNHHVALGQLQKVSTREKNYVADGFFAKTVAEELRCPDLELNVLLSMENVTGTVLGVVKPGMPDKAALDARKAMIAQIAKESTEKTGLRSDVVTFYQGGEYWLYRYKKYTDVRLVMAPEQQIAFFGGDPDNFTYPRYDLDMTFFRAYENEKPVQSKEYLKWNKAGAQDGDLVFVSGHPGSTNRLQTLAQTEYQRDFAYPARLKSSMRTLELLKKYSQLGPEQKRRAAEQIFGIENSLKASEGEYNGLLDKDMITNKQMEEKDFRERVNANPEWKKAYAWAWDSISVAIERQRTLFKGSGFRSLRGRLSGFAAQLVQHASEITKPNGERLVPYQDANIASTKFRLFSPAPVYDDLEELQLADGLRQSLAELGADDPFVKTVLGNKTPEDVAKELVNGTKLANPEVRKSLFEGGEAVVTASNDPMVVLARKLAPMTQETRAAMERNITAITASASAAIGKARFGVYGRTTSPDATFTLRLSYGAVKGYPMNGTAAPAKTTMYGLYDRALSFNNAGPFELPKRFLEGRDKLELATPLNFVSSCDIIGGNSGSPVVDRQGQFVGLIFDGNIESLPGRFLYSELKNRAVAVHPAAIIECLRKLYDAGSLADELEGVPKKAELQAPHVSPKAAPGK